MSFAINPHLILLVSVRSYNVMAELNRTFKLNLLYSCRCLKPNQLLKMLPTDFFDNSMMSTLKDHGIDIEIG
jgi:hypothetical protein